MTIAAHHGGRPLTRRDHDGRKTPKRRRNTPIAEDTEALAERFSLVQRRRGLAEATIRSRGCRLVLLAEWLFPRGLLEATREDVERFLDERPLSPRARYGYISDLATFYRVMMEDERTTSDPTAYLHRPRMRIALPRPIGDDDLADAIAQAPPVIAAALTLAAFQGLRSKEIAHLHREDIIDTNDPPMLHVREGKGGKDRVLPLHPDVMPALRRADVARSGRALRRPDGGPFDSMAMSKAVNEYLHNMGIDATLHQLRHWFGTKTYQATRDLRLVQALLGHASPTSTAVYAQYAIEGAEPAVTGLKVARRQTLADHDDPSELSV